CASIAQGARSSRKMRVHRAKCAFIAQNARSSRKMRVHRAKCAETLPNRTGSRSTIPTLSGDIKLFH
ncbi:MAG: hypothetical protein ACREEM_10870, partial [Blastocatellia bacterium]